jgi:type I restriction enzyme R subunit
MRQIESFKQRRLPHWDVPDAAFFVTTCLSGSIPAEGLLDLEKYRAGLEMRPKPPTIEEREWRRQLWKLAFSQVESWLDKKPAARHLADPRLAQIVMDGMFHFAGIRYDLLAFVIMPSHIHWVFQPLPLWVESLPESQEYRSARQRIQHSLNRFTALRCNEMRGTTGDFWQRESYDHWVRDSDELERIIIYIESNPVKAGLVDRAEEWVFSSAHQRRTLGTPFGMPLVRKA